VPPGGFFHNCEIIFSELKIEFIKKPPAGMPVVVSSNESKTLPEELFHRIRYEGVG